MDNIAKARSAARTRQTGIDTIESEYTGVSRVIYRSIKRVTDIIISLMLLILLSPLFLILAILIKLESKGSVIHGRKCVSRDGEYTMYNVFAELFRPALCNKVPNIAL